jgi:hypothetical protein
MSKYKGDLTGFPDELVEWMLDQQEAQGNKRDVSVFETDRTACRISGGFTWDYAGFPFKTPKDPSAFCEQVIQNRCFGLITEYFPKKWEFEPENDLDALPKPENVVVQLDVLDKMRFKAACAAMVALLSSHSMSFDLTSELAIRAVACADDLIEALKKGKQDDTTTTH